MKAPLLLLLHLLVAPVPASRPLFPKPEDCKGIDPRSSGVHTIFPAGGCFNVTVMCDMDTDGGGWTVISARIDGTLNFYRPWNQYKVGFGLPPSEYWIGLDNLHYLTSQKKYELRVVLEDFDGNTVFARYRSFSVGGECCGYQLTVGGFVDGGAGDALIYHNGMKFSTWDRDNDLKVDEKCAKNYLGAFWYKDCHQTNPNGAYSWRPNGTNYGVGITWFPWKGHYYSMKKFIMMIRPLDD